MSTERKVRSHRTVIVRAYDDEPVRLRLVRDAGRYIIVGHYDTRHTIGFPRDRVYVFEETMFETMRQTFVAGDEATLSLLWERCAKWREVAHQT